MSSSSVEVLGRFGRHTPRILRRQLIHQLTEQYTTHKKEGNSGSSPNLNIDIIANNICCVPSIQRFHGALLFVDISGFTALSLRLSVEELKNHINDYFTKMLDIVDKHGGDVVKFAGDALFIVWHILASSDSGSDSPRSPKNSVEKSTTKAENLFKVARRTAIEKGVACGMEISITCGNQKVNLTSPNQDKSMGNVSPTKASQNRNSMLRNILPSLTGMFTGSTPTNAQAAAPAEESLAYLNVHAGVSTGLMAGIDIGANDRWEFFLVGEPLSKVAVAESLADTGEVVLSPEAHEIMHPSTPIAKKAARRVSVSSLRLRMNREPSLSKMFIAPEPIELPALDCGCERKGNGFCAMNRSRSPTAGLKKSRTKAKIDMSVMLDETFINDSKLLESVEDDANAAHLAATDRLNRAVDSIFEEQHPVASVAATEVSDDASEETKDTNNNDITNNNQIQINKPVINSSDHNSLRTQYLKWLNACLSDDLARHAHQVTRDELTFKNIDRTNVLRLHLDAVLRRNSTTNLPSNGRGLTIQLTPLSPLSRTMSFNLSTTPKMASMRGMGMSSRRLLDIQDPNAMLAEIRTVTVLFIKIDVTNMELLVDSNVRRTPKAKDRKVTSAEVSKQVKGETSSWFLAKTINEAVADQMLLDRMQLCFACLSDSFDKYGGQMRQFIVDDKGTVCIGTFGLRGSVNNDNAAAALDAAKTIVDNLQEIGLSASVGVTVGRAYCGLVGSAKRHEYAVMGPSTNLSARLMGKAPPGGIMCDNETRSRDRSHNFLALSDIIAKGYKDPVGTFKPEFNVHIPSFILSGKVSGSLSIAEHLSLLQNLMSSKSGFGGDAVPYSTSVSIRKNKSSSMHEANFDSVKINLKSNPKPSAFFNVQERSFHCNANGTRLQGREAEIDQCLSFLFASNMLAPEGPLSPKSSKLSGGVAQRTIFCLDNETRVVALQGPQGIGKESVVNAIAHHIYVSTKRHNSYNVQLFKCHTNAYAQNSPFSAWKPVTQEMILRLFQAKSSAADAAKCRRRSLVSSVAAVNTEMTAAVDYLLTNLLPTYAEYLPLMSVLANVPADAKGVAALQLSPGERIAILSQLVLAIIQLFPQIVRKMILLTINNVETLDSASSSLLRLIFSQSVGVVVLMTCQQNFPLTDPFTCDDGDEARYLRMELKSLDKFITAAIIGDVLNAQSSSFASIKSPASSSVDEATVDRIFEVSKGNPTYIYEIAKSIAERRRSSVAAIMAVNTRQEDGSLTPNEGFTDMQSQMTADDENSVEGAIHSLNGSFYNNRIDEIICRRFDQMGSQAQTVLKIASAACGNGHSFTYELLQFVTREQSSKKPSNRADSPFMSEGVAVNVPDVASPRVDGSNLINVLFDIIRRGDFIVVTLIGSNEQIEKTALQKVHIARNKYEFHFDVAIEASTVYGLLLEDYKQVIHESIAEFYHSKRLAPPTPVRDSVKMPNKYSAATMRAEEGYHWHQAFEHPKAMQCYYLAAIAEQKQGIQAFYWSHAYLMFLQMHQAECDLATRGMSSAVASLEDVQSMLHRSQFNSDPQSPSAVCQVNYDPDRLTLSDVHGIFNGDSELLHIGMLVQIKAIQQAVHQYASPVETQQQIETAMEILALVKTPTMLSASHVSGILNSSLQSASSDSNANSSAKRNNAMYFYLEDFHSICLPVAAGYVENYLLLDCATNAQNASRVPIVQCLVNFLLTSSSETEATRKASHRIEALALCVLVDCRLQTSREESDALLQELIHYDFARHSPELIMTYGADIVGLALTTQSQKCLLSDRWALGVECIDRAVAVFRKTEHVATLTKAVIPMCSVLVFLRRFEDALMAFNEYQMECQTHHLLVEPVTESINRIYLEWLSRLLRSDLNSNRGSLLKAAVGEDDPDVDLILQQGCLTCAGEVGGDERSVLYDYLRLFGRSVEGVFADMCAVKIAAMSQITCDESFDEALTLYVDFTLSAEANSSGQTTPSFNTICTLLTVMQARNAVCGSKERSSVVQLLATGWLTIDKVAPLGAFSSAVMTAVTSHDGQTQSQKEKRLAVADGLASLKHKLGDEVFLRHEELFKGQFGLGAAVI